MTNQQPHTSHIEEVCSAYVQYHHFNSYGMDDSEETEKSFYRMIARIEAAAEQRGAIKALRSAADHLGNQGPLAMTHRQAHDCLNNRADRLEGDDG